MPRDLAALKDEATEQTLGDMPDLSEQLPGPRHIAADESTVADDDDGWVDEGAELKIYSRMLTMSDLEACIVLENEAFPEEQRCSREKFIYRLTVCPNLCHGLFTSSSPTHYPQHLSAATAPHASKIETTSDRRAILLAHAISTLSTNPTIRDEDMAMPPSWTPSSPTRAKLDAIPSPSTSNETRQGHKPEGHTVMLHSLAVLPSYQNQGLGSLLLRSYTQTLRSSGNYERLVLLADSGHVGYYEKRGFAKLGRSEATFGGVEWSDLGVEFEGGGGAED